MSITGHLKFYFSTDYSECGGLLYGNEGVVSRPLAPNYANEGNSYCKWTLQQEQAGTGFNVSK